ncbi:MAG: hypothetical protein M1818_004141 [Claussenomyces sp. TS43310]|nr:MAG: hypothetical protein M1818_004141 [Claussenomyces sp. TS43310]
MALTPGSATNVEGIFRLSGAEKRIKELRTIFDSPDRYGKGLDWDGYTVHDAANVLRRYLNQLPEPIVPLDLYDRFREPLRGHTYQAVGDQDAFQAPDDFDLAQTIQTYQQLITELPPLNMQLLLYILDLLAVFASKSDENRMTSQNLAAIFQPGLLSHPSHDMAPAEYRLSQDVLVFLIENQDHFLIGMRGTAADEKTVQDVQKGVTPPASIPSTPNSTRGKTTVVRSASNASAGDSVRKVGLRRGASVASGHSRQSNGAPSPASLVHTPTGGGVHRSNTLPSKKSPAIPSSRLQRPPEITPYDSGATPVISAIPSGKPGPVNEAAASSMSGSSSPSFVPIPIGTSGLASSSDTAKAERSQERLLDNSEVKLEHTTPVRERTVSNLFQRTPTTESEKRLPNKLRKKKLPGSSNPSAHSSTNSLHGQAGGISPGVYPTQETEEVPEHTVLERIPSVTPVVEETVASPKDTQAREMVSHDPTYLSAKNEQIYNAPDGILKLQGSSNSLRSGDVSATDQSDMEPIDDPVLAAEQKEKRRRWRLSRKKDDSVQGTYMASPKKSNGGAETSSTSVGTSSLPRKSFTGEVIPGGLDVVPANTQLGNDHGTGAGKEDKKGPLGWIKTKMREAQDKREHVEKEQFTKSGLPDHNTGLPTRGQSVEITRPAVERQAENLPPVPEI